MDCNMKCRADAERACRAGHEFTAPKLDDESPLVRGRHLA